MEFGESFPAFPVIPGIFFCRLPVRENAEMVRAGCLYVRTRPSGFLGRTAVMSVADGGSAASGRCGRIRCISCLFHKRGNTSAGRESVRVLLCPGNDGICTSFSES